MSQPLKFHSLAHLETVRALLLLDTPVHFSNGKTSNEQQNREVYDQNLADKEMDNSSDSEAVEDLSLKDGSVDGGDSMESEVVAENRRVSGRLSKKPNYFGIAKEKDAEESTTPADIYYVKLIMAQRNAENNKTQNLVLCEGDTKPYWLDSGILQARSFLGMLKRHQAEFVAKEEIPEIGDSVKELLSLKNSSSKVVKAKYQLFANNALSLANSRYCAFNFWALLQAKKRRFDTLGVRKFNAEQLELMVQYTSQQPLDAYETWAPLEGEVEVIERDEV